MRLCFQERNLNGGRRFGRFVKRRVKTAFARMEHAVQSVTVILSDVNGPKGGKDQQCKVLVTLDGRREIVIRDQQENMMVAISNAVFRASYQVSQQIKRAMPRRSPFKSDQLEYEMIPLALPAK